MNYDETIKTLNGMKLIYFDELEGGNPSEVNECKIYNQKIDLAIKTIRTAKKEHELLELYRQAFNLMFCARYDDTRHYIVKYTDDVKFNLIIDKITKMEEK